MQWWYIQNLTRRIGHYQIPGKAYLPPGLTGCNQAVLGPPATKLLETAYLGPSEDGRN